MTRKARLVIAVTTLVIGGILVSQATGWGFWQSNSQAMELCYDLTPQNIELIHSENTCVSTRFDLVPFRVTAVYETADGKFVERSKTNPLAEGELIVGALLILLGTPISLLLPKRPSRPAPERTGRGDGPVSTGD